MADNYALPPKQRVINLINEDNPGANLSVDMVSMGPVQISTANNRNTLVMLTANPGFGIQPGSQREVWYNRLNLAQYFNGQPITVQVDNVFSTHDLLQPILQQLQTWLGEDDVVLSPITTVNKKATVTLQAAPGSYAWTGSVTVNIIPVQIPLATIWQTLNLAVFTTATLFARSVQQLLDAINANNYASVPLTSVTFSQPVMDTSVPGTDTRVTITAVTNEGYSGNVNVHYSRVNIINDYPSGISMSGTWVDPLTAHNLLTLLQTRDNIGAIFTEIQNATLNNNSRTQVLNLTNSNYVYAPLGQFTVQLPQMPLSKLWPTNVQPNFANPSITVDGWAQVLGLINTTHATSLANTDIGFTNLVVGGGAENTSVRATALAPLVDYTGFVDIAYNRVAFPTAPITMTGGSVYTTTLEVLAALRTQMGININDNQILADTIPDGATTAQLVLLDNHPLWMPGTVVNVTLPVPSVGGNFFLPDGSNLLFPDGSYYLTPGEAP